MGLFDRSSSTTNLTEQNLQEIVTENLGAQDVSGVNVGKAGGNIEIAIDQVDSGTVAAAKELGSGAIALAGDTTAAVLRANGNAITEAARALTDSVSKVAGIASDSVQAQNNITEYVTGQIANTVRDANAASSDLASAAISGNRTVLEDALSFGSNAIKSTQQTLADTVNKALSTLSGAVGSAADATRSDASQVLNNIAKYGAIAAAVVVVAVLFSKVKSP